MTHSHTPGAMLRPVLTALTLTAAAAAQVTDPAVFTPFGTECGPSLSASDTILPNGDHMLQFDVSGAYPVSPVVLFFGGQQVNWPLPQSSCTSLTDLAFHVVGFADSSGDAMIAIQAPASTDLHLYSQAMAIEIDSPITSSGGLEIQFPGISPTPDPSTAVEHPCYYIYNFNWDYGGDGVPLVVGKIRFPSDTCSAQDGPPTNRPVVVFMHGNGMDHQDHDHLMAHLARNGFVTASIANGGYLGGSNEGRARQAISYLNAMHDNWLWGHRLSNDVVFMGHSRGGEAAVTAARLLHEQPNLGTEDFTVRAVVSLAPTDGGGDNSDPHESLTGSMTDGFLGIYGAHDPDVRGTRLEDPINDPENTVFAIYDRAGHESSVEGLLLQPQITKSMVYVHGATHLDFLDECQPISSPRTISCEDHRNILRGYATAFLRWKVWGENDYQAYFDGRAEPASVRIEDVDLFTQFSDQKRPHRVLDNFEQGGLGTNTLGDTVTQGAGIAVSAEGELWQLDSSAPHDTRGMRIKWTDTPTSWVRWGIPNGTVPFVGPTRDVTNYDFLSLRVGQNYNDAWNTPDEDQDFYVRIFTGTGFSPFVKISDHGRIPYPDAFVWHPFPYPLGDWTKSGMSTVRIPLEAFGGVDLTDVRSVYFYFTVPGHEIGSMNVDSLEFVK